MMMKLRSYAKVLGRNFSTSAETALIPRKHIETAKKVSGGLVGLVGGYGLAVATVDNRSQYVIAHEEKTMEYMEKTKKLIKEKAKHLRELEELKQKEKHNDSSFVGEPLEIDESEYMHDLKKAKNRKKQCSAVNWLQCREEDTNGDICGKWRRAPPSDVQTKDWECYCCFFWDPSRADCAVPQELETSEVLKQLKYIKMLRPRSDAKRRKLGPKARSRSHNKGKC